jgi:hypothetical protein
LLDRISHVLPQIVAAIEGGESVMRFGSEDERAADIHRSQLNRTQSAPEMESATNLHQSPNSRTPSRAKNIKSTAKIAHGPLAWASKKPPTLINKKSGSRFKAHLCI